MIIKKYKLPRYYLAISTAKAMQLNIMSRNSIAFTLLIRILLIDILDIDSSCTLNYALLIRLYI